MKKRPSPSAPRGRGKWRRRLLLAGAIPLGLIALVALALVIASPRLTPFIEGPAFKKEIEKQTSRGLHFQGSYGTIERTGFATASCDEFHATSGVKAMKTLDAQGITARFNPWGVLLRRWQLDYIHIERGKVEIQTYEPKPDPKRQRPWYAIFMPRRVHLCEVVCPQADITWRMKGDRGGIFDTSVRILPYGHDFEYFAEGGRLRSGGGIAPEMGLDHLHMVITKKELTLHTLQLSPSDSGSITVAGTMGMRDDKHIDMRMDFERVPLAPWMPRSLSGEIRGTATGHVIWQGDDQTLEASSGQGELQVSGGRLDHLPLLEFLAAATARKDLKTLDLTSCDIAFRWDFPTFEIHRIDLAAREGIALRGSVSIQSGGALSGTLDLGLSPESLKWLPRAQEEIFTRSENGLLWTKVKLSGTLTEPQDDLSPRIAAALKKDPAAAAGLFLRGAGEWIEQKVRGR